MLANPRGKLEPSADETTLTESFIPLPHNQAPCDRVHDDEDVIDTTQTPGVIRARKRDAQPAQKRLSELRLSLIHI